MIAALESTVARTLGGKVSVNKMRPKNILRFSDNKARDVSFTSANDLPGVLALAASYS